MCKILNVFISSYLIYFSGLTEEADCSPCLGGYYCPTVGIVEPELECDQGYFCLRSAEIAGPNQGNLSLQSLKHNLD